MLRIFAQEYTDIAEALSATNQLFRQDTGESGMFVTVLASIYDYKTKTLSYCSCGHNPGLIRRQNGFVEMMGFNGMAMGVIPLNKETSHIVQLYAGDAVIFYTDGITEAHNENGQFFGEERLIQCLQNEEFSDASQIIDRIVEQLTVFVGKAPQHDDMTLLVMKIKQTPVEE